MIDVEKILQKKEAAWSRIQRAADEIRRREPTITREQAVAKAVTETPDLYTAYVQAEQGR